MKKSIFTITIAIFSVTILISQIEFDERDLINGDQFLRFPIVIEKIDIDNDGDLDLMAACNIFRKIWWHEALDNGSFGPQIIISEGSDPSTNNYLRALKLFDFDNDDDLDLFYITNKGAVIKENIGDGIFTTKVVKYEDDRINEYVNISDIDSDGDLDILLRINGEEHLRWYENNEGNSFEDSKILADIIIEAPVFVEDYDGDGDIDILTSDDNKAVWHENRSFFLEHEQHVIPTPTNFKLNSVFYSTDIDSDGKQDFYFIGTREHVPQSIHSDWVIGHSENTIDSLGFGDIEDLIVFPYEEEATALYFEDLDGDDDKDIIVYKSDESVVWYENIDSKGGFDFTNENILLGFIKEMKDLLTIDEDKDGDLDVISVAKWNNQINSSENINGLGTFNPPSNISEYAYRPRNIELVDFDNDGDVDVFCGSEDGKFMWFENLDGYIEFGNQQVVATYWGNYYVQLGDIDNDGDVDIVAQLDDDEELVWYENIGDNVFSFKQIIKSDFKLTSNFKLIDLGKDGNYDILYKSNKNLVWAEFNSEISDIIIKQEIQFGSLYSFIQIESESDIISFMCTDEIGKSISTITYNKEISLFDDKELILDNVSEHNIVAQAINLSDALEFDILYYTVPSNVLTRELYTKLRKADGTFNNSVLLSSTYISGLSVNDLDSDGDNDIVATYFNSNRVEWFENLDGAGNFGNKQTIDYDLFQVIDVVCDDLDEDGDIDLVCASGKIHHSSIVYYENKQDNGNDIRGRVSIDLANDDCLTSSNYPNGLMVSAQSGSTTISSTAASSGFYQLFPKIGEYETKITSEFPSYFDVIPEKYDHIFTDFGNSETADFCLVANSTKNDVEVSIYSIDDPRIGEPHIYVLRYKNVGTTLASGEITFDYNNQDKLKIVDTSHDIFNEEDNVVSFKYIDLKPFESRTIEVETLIEIPPLVTLGDNLNIKASIIGNQGDITINNNFDEVDEIVVGSYDPNDIQVKEGSSIHFSEVGEYLHYIVRFQNTGTSYANKVVIENHIDENLNPNSFELLGASHEIRIEIDNDRDIDFIFNDIGLIDSTTNESESHGYVSYRIRTMNNLNVGDFVENSAAIFFDFNSPIFTNIVSTSIREELNVINNNISDVEIYPNPTLNSFKIETMKPITQIELFDLGSRRLFTTKSTNVNISALDRGLYIVKIFFEDKSIMSKRIIKN